MLLPTLLTLALADGHLEAAEPPISRGGLVTAPEGYRVQLPRGFTYAARVHGGRAIFAATAPDQGTVVSVSSFASDEPLTCEAGADGDGVSDPGVGTPPERFETESGLEGCLTGEAALGLGGLAAAYVRGRDGGVIAVEAIALCPEAAGRLAREVAVTVAIGTEREPLVRGLPRRDDLGREEAAAGDGGPGHLRGLSVARSPGGGAPSVVPGDGFEEDVELQGDAMMVNRTVSSRPED